MISYCYHRHSKPDPHSPALEVVDLSAGYTGYDQPALKDIHFSIPRGASMALVGPNGAGKSTLLKAISGLIRIDKGQIKVFGHHLGECHHRVVYLPQRSEIDWHFPISVLDFVLLGRYVYLGWFKRPTAQDRSIAIQALKQMAVDDLAGRQVSKLSGGQQQRVLIARALAQNADLLLLDEPLNAVDSSTRDIVTGVLNSIKSEGKTIMVATHYYDQEEGRYDGAIYLRDGQQINEPHVKHTEDCC
jgi:ABC-type Mn2+/Zn2+ transport system ATPase subunit